MCFYKRQELTVIHLFAATQMINPTTAAAISGDP
jgi:hypothetical protein